MYKSNIIRPGNKYDSISIALPETPGRYGKELRGGEILKFSYRWGVQMRDFNKPPSRTLEGDEGIVVIQVFPPSEDQGSESYKISINKEKGFILDENGIKNREKLNENSLNSYLSEYNIASSLDELKPAAIESFMLKSLNEASTGE